MAVLAGCSQGPVPSDSIFDPFEDVNRATHEFNKLADTVVLRPAALVYGVSVPEPVQDIVDNTVNNLALPGQAVNHLLQGDLDSMFITVGRFALNSTIGIAGLMDPATDLGLMSLPTDFGETMGFWGVPEGPYVELPFFGPSTTRDTAGMFVDFAIDPLRQFFPSPQREYLFVLKGVDIVGDRHAYADLVDILLYESADSYAAQRLTYLQNKRRTISGETNVEDLEDPYAFEY